LNPRDPPRFGKSCQTSERYCTVLSADTIRRIYRSGEALIVESRRRRRATIDGPLSWRQKADFSSVLLTTRERTHREIAPGGALNGASEGAMVEITKRPGPSGGF
jgi:hypothetical protein